MQLEEKVSPMGAATVAGLKSVSVIVPTSNSARVLERCLESIARQDYPGELVEIIIADNGSTDGTVEIAQRYTQRICPNPLRTGEAGKAASLKHASNELVALIDSDNILPFPDWLLGRTPFNRDHAARGMMGLYVVLVGRPRRLGATQADRGIW